VVVNIESYIDASLEKAPLEINATVLDNSIEDAELFLDLMVARAKGEGRLSLFARVGAAPRNTVSVECAPEGALPQFFN